jgi:asparagine synthase (glutamine-hydrolysing)
VAPSAIILFSNTTKKRTTEIMCGICGKLSFINTPVSASEIQKMMDRIHHRGPDDDGIYLKNNIGFGFKRLSIIDLSMAGHQPMQDSSERYTIVFNGEIYNYIELRDQLKVKGYTFRSNTDTEVLLTAYIEWGIECLSKLNGMFAFAIYDSKEGKVCIARDRYGVKPLYYFKDDEQIIFSSEIPSILSILPKDQIRVNNQSLFEYLAFNRTDQTTETFFKNINKLQHGHYITIENSDIKICRWYKLQERINNPFASPEEFKDLFSSSVGLRLRSDVPVGVCLSGGLDSSSIVSILLNDFQKKDLNTFSAIYGDGVYGDESKYIGLFRNSLTNMHFTRPNADTLLKDVYDFVESHGEPVPSTSPYAQFKVMELAKDHVKVTLDGQGADEELAGYHYFFGNYFKELLYTARILKLFNESYYYLKEHKSLFALKTFLFFMLPEGMKTSASLNKRGYIDSNFSNQYSSGNVIASQLYNSNSLQEALLNHFEYKLEHLLKWEDRNSMWFSIESRVPFLDYRLVEKTLALPSDQLINKGYTKYILREAMKGIASRSD